MVAFVLVFATGRVPMVELLEPGVGAESSPGAASDGIGVDITSPVRVTTTTWTSSALDPLAGIETRLASSGVTDFHNCPSL